MPSSELSPVKPRILSTGGVMAKQQEILMYGGLKLSDSYRKTSDHRLHRLDLTTLQWSAEALGRSGSTMLYFAPLCTATVLLDSVLVVFGGFPRLNKETLTVKSIMWNDIWGYYNYVKARLWIKYLPRGRKPPARILHAATAIDLQTMVIYGGINLDSIELLYDLWSFSLPTLDENLLNLSEQQNGSQWKMMHGLGPNTSYAMSLVNIDNILYMYGGSQTVLNVPDIFSGHSEDIKISFSCVNTLWTYSLVHNTGWIHMESKGRSPGNRCFHQSHAFGNKMLLTGGCSNNVVMRFNRCTLIVEIKCEADKDTEGVWIYDPDTISWLELSAQPLYHLNVFGVFSVVWNDLLLSFGGLPLEQQSATDHVPDDWNGFSVFKPACPAGMTSKNLKVEMCYNCPVGQFSSTSHSPCSQCPDGLTTEHEGSGSPVNCSRCVDNYCGYGTCYVTLPGPSSTCQCQFGFTKNNKGLCTVATFYIAASGFVSGVALFVLIIVLLTKFRKARKDHKVIIKNKDHELMELTNVFNIDSKELKLRKRIDKDCPGGYGEVYQAEYREMMVAVKKLQGIHMELDRIELEFEREIEVMRAIRHSNIVLFIGGGRYHDDGCPFLVVEYMARGSLTSILNNRKIDLEDNLKLRFTADTAKGMRFLHSQRPPRVHRDLKSSNLLVSQQWVVKVADFGSARLVKDEGISQDAVRGAGPLDLTAPLLGADYQLSSGVGTPSWCAPEILSGQGYGTAADVYSFGIVMWEIWSRELPYVDRNFQSILDLKAAVLGGVRPSVLQDEHSDYVELMRDCWACDETSRPTFHEIAIRLEEMSDNYCPFGEKK
ncbi:probable serine/threonine-protein kinase DDB_G0278509 [Corticium candelabrum]|uniref:probable serine/threonine-protein kinase DDB_G0278509 n=1 Tax=Corticium candelabrum TaxID=121492 RepID=UPI002E25F177|nr:probable serine/threonine-protein kinase DDB_G0278509 [Corticium candelabrum]